MESTPKHVDNSVGFMEQLRSMEMKADVSRYIRVLSATVFEIIRLQPVTATIKTVTRSYIA